MSYKPPVSAKSGYGPMGKALVQLSSDGTKVRVLMEVDGEQKDFRVLRSNCPDELRAGTWIVGMSEKLDKVFSIKPSDGVYLMKFAYIRSKKKDEPPMQELNAAYNYYFFKPVFEIVSEEAKGMKVGYRFGLDYNFVGVEDEDGKLIVAYSKNLANSSHTRALDDFMTLCGVWDRGAMPYKEPTILPYIQKRALAADKTIHGVIKEGFIHTIAP